MRTPPFKTLAIATGLAFSISVAKAAVVTGTYSVAGSNFTSSSSTAAPPFASITESFTITFNNTATVSEQTAGISLNASTITPTSPLGFTYIAGLDTLIVGGTNAVASSDPTKTDFALVINNASNVAAFGITSLTYSTATNAVFSAQTVGRATATATPEPASIALLGSAIAAVGFVRRRRAA